MSHDTAVSRERVLAIIREELGAPEATEDSLLSDVGDSLDAMEIVMVLEKELDIDVYDDDLAAMGGLGNARVGDLINVACAKARGDV